MGAMYYLKKLRDRYVAYQVRNIRFPPFHSKRIVRARIMFSGRVQNVGFRLEIYQLAKRLDLRGWVKNSGKDVEAEMQGEDDRIAYIIGYMRSLKRASVKKVLVTELAAQTDEEDFSVIE
jgi:acylphosphatase